MQTAKSQTTKVVVTIVIVTFVFLLLTAGLIIFFVTKQSNKNLIDDVTTFNQKFNQYSSNINKGINVSKTKLNITNTTTELARTNSEATEIIAETDNIIQELLASSQKLNGNQTKNLKSAYLEYQTSSTKFLIFLQDQISWDKNISPILDEHQRIWYSVANSPKTNTYLLAQTLTTELSNLKKLENDLSQYKEPSRFTNTKNIFTKLVKSEIDYLSYVLGYTNDVQASARYQQVAKQYATEVKTEYELLMSDLNKLEKDLETKSKDIELEINKIINNSR